MIVQATFLVVLAIFLYKSFSEKSRKDAEHLKKVKGFPTLPIIGNLHQIGSDSKTIFRSICKFWEEANYGTFKLYFGPKVFTFISEPDTIEVILSSNVEITKGEDYSLFESWLGNGLLLSTESATGVEVKALLNKDLNLARASYRISEIMHLREFKPLLRFPLTYRLSKEYRDEQECLKILHNFSSGIIKSRKAAMQNQPSESLPTVDDFGRKRKTAFLDSLLMAGAEDGKLISDEDIRDEVDNIIFAGHDTTASLLSFATFVLSQNPEIQQKIFQEQEAIFGSDMLRDVKVQDLAEMKYLEMFIKETLRMYPSAPIIGRKLQGDLQFKDGVILPAGTTIAIFIYGLGRNPKFVDKPEIFNPERFSIENTKGKHPYSYVPFSAGPRNCIGQKFAMYEIKTTLSKLVRNFEFYNKGIENQKLELVAEAVLKSKNGFVIKLKKRSL